MLKTAVLVTCTFVAACGDNLVDHDDLTPISDDIAKRCAPSTMRTDLAWHGTNRETLTGWLDAHGCASEGYDRHERPIALFDWDNTVLKNDVGDAITFYLIKNDKVLQPPDGNWKRVNRYMTEAAAAALTAACGTDVAPGYPLPTSTNLACADELLSMYIDNKTRAGATAFAGHDFRRLEPTYAFTVQLLAGYTPHQVKQMTEAATTPMLAAPEGATQVVGTRTLNGWLRIYDQTADLILAAQSRGYDVWVITASPQDVVATMAPLAGVPAKRVIGVRSLKRHGRLTYDFEGCGPVADGENTMMSYIEGKRCWVNKIIFGDDSPGALDRRHDPRQIFGAGDSDTDIEFMRDSTYKFALNRAKTELMCFAYHNENDSWRVNPMFIQPRAQRPTPFPCSTTACVAADGTKVPCLDESGAVIPDQVDAVHP